MTGSTLHVRWDGGALAASIDQAPVLIGRGPDASVHIADRSVSRAHLRVLAEDGIWVAIDESSRGTYDDAGQQVVRLAVSEVEATLHLGSPAGPGVRLSSVAPSPPSAGDDDGDGTSVSAPYVPPIDTGEAWTVATSDTTLRLEVDGANHAYTPPGRVIVGRDPGCDVVCDNELVSRQHLAFTAAETEWTMEDLGSSRGTYVDGKRLQKQRPARGAFVAVLGDEDAGERVQVVTAGVHKRPRDRSKWVMALAVLVIGALISVGVARAFIDDDGDAANTPAQLAAAKQSTVYIFTVVEGNLAASGSGSFVSDELILTNAHVADLSAEFSSPLYIATTDDEDAPSEMAFIAVETARHPYLDLALLRIDDEETQQLVDELEGSGDAPGNQDPQPVPLGDSSDLVIGSDISSLGFPVLSSQATRNEEGKVVLPVVTVADGTITGLRAWPGCGSDVEVLPPSSCSTDGDLPRGNLVADGFGGSGISGGPVIVDGVLVGVRYAGWSPVDDEESGAQTTSGLGLAMPIEYFRDWLDDQISGA